MTNDELKMELMNVLNDLLIQFQIDVLDTLKDLEKRIIALELRLQNPASVDGHDDSYYWEHG